MNSWSYSRFSSAIRCMRHYKLASIDKLAPPTTSCDLKFGTAVHLGLNAFLTGEDGKAIFDIYWESLRADQTIEYGRMSWIVLRELGWKFMNTFERKYAAKMKMSFAEIRLYAEFAGIKVEGTPDFIGTYDGVMCLLDFKTSGYNYDKEKEHTALQLSLYAYLAKESLGVDLMKLGYFVFNKGTGCIQTPMLWDYDKAIVEAHLEDLKAYCDLLDSQIEKGVFPKNPNSCMMGARKCEYFNICWRTEKEAG